MARYLLYYRRVMMHNMRLLLASCFLLAGCQFTESMKGVNEPSPTPYVPKNVYAAGYLSGIKRVALLPVYYEEELAPHLETMDATLDSELTRKGRFEVVPVTRNTMKDLFGAYQFSSVSMLPDNLLTKIREESNADAILFIDITHFSPYKPLSVGIRAKLVDVRDGKILWAFDDLFDAGSPSVAYSATQFQRYHDRASYPLDTSSTILQSPRKFMKYVAFEVFKSLPSQRSL